MNDNKLSALPYYLFKPFSIFLLNKHEYAYLMYHKHVKHIKVGLNIDITDDNLIKVFYSIIYDSIEKNVHRDEKDLFDLSGDGYFFMSGNVFEYTYSFSEYNSSNNDDGTFKIRLASIMSEEMLKKHEYVYFKIRLATCIMSEEMLKKLEYVVVYLEPKKVPLDDNPLI